MIEQQNHKEFLKLRNQLKSVNPNGAYDKLVVSLSIQPVLSFAAKYEVDPKESRGKLSSLFRNLGADLVYDIEFATELSLLDCGRDFVDRFHSKEAVKKSTPVLSSACPGWICYAEKTHGDWILPYVSQIKSPQQIAASIIKELVPAKVDSTASRIVHVTVMPCFDKKLEASRLDFALSDAKEVDMVITPVEIEQMMEDLGISFVDLPISPMDSLLDQTESNILPSVTGSGSGGYAEHVLRFAAKELFDIDLDEIHFQTVRLVNHHNFLFKTNCNCFNCLLNCLLNFLFLEIPTCEKLF